MLDYNGRTVRVRAVVVDTGQNNWVIADDTNSYFQEAFRALVPDGRGQPCYYVYVSPRVPSLQPRDIVEVEGTYDANSDVLYLRSAKRLGSEGATESPEPPEAGPPIGVPPSTEGSGGERIPFTPEGY